MCGIAGVLSWDQRFRVTRETLEKMSACIAHRGPDGQGAYLNHEQPINPTRPQCGLVHRRLAVLDPSERALQPFEDPSGKRWLVFNGEIYNFRQLRDEISKLQPCYAWRTHCDTEVLLAAYLTWGEKCVDHLNGMFAFALWDEIAGSLLLARDRMGQKPLFYALAADGVSIAFASEIAALKQVPWVDTSILARSVTDYLCWGYVTGARTIYAGIHKLRPATCLKIQRSGIHDWRYFNCNQAVREGELWSGDEAPAQAARRLITQAVQRQLVSDVPLGCFLSGGIDSSIIAAAMKQALGHQQPLLTFSIGFDDPLYDETPYAAEVARHLDTRHQQFIVKPNAAEDLPKLAAVFGEPFADSSALPTHYLSRETRRHVKVALSGDGGDELFGGYDRYRAMQLAAQLRRWPRTLRALLGRPLWQKLPGTHPKSRLTRLKRFLASVNDSPRRRYSRYMRLFDDVTLWELLEPGLHESWYASDEWLVGEFGSLWNRDDVRTALAVDRITYLPEDLLAKVDRASMLHALEVRSPLLDHDLVRFASLLPADQLVGGVGGFGHRGKRLLREAFAADLPSRVFSRPKTGFALPISRWLRGELKGMLHDLLFAQNAFSMQHFQKAAVQRLVQEHEQHHLDHGQRLYALLMLELWWRA